LNHTILLRTRNRNEWLNNCLNHYKNFDYEGYIIVGDDSNSMAFDLNRKIINKYKRELRIKHIQGIGNLENTRARRVLLTTHQMYKMVETKYFSVSSDDDFNFPEFIRYGIELFENKLPHDFVCVQGPEILLTYNDKKKIVKSSVHLWGEATENDPLQRILNYAQFGSIAYYGVIKSEIINTLKNDSLTFTRSTQSDLAFFDEEIPWLLLIFISGKIHAQYKLPMGARGLHQSFDRLDTYHKDYTNKTYYLGPIWEFAQDLSPKSLREAHSVISNLILQKKSVFDPETVHDIVWQVLGKKMMEYSPPLDHQRLSFTDKKNARIASVDKNPSLIKRIYRLLLNEAKLSTRFDFSILMKKHFLKRNRMVSKYIKTDFKFTNI
jgi:glycosyltransferase domain-containing protein